MTNNVLSDASAILNIGHWKTFATKVVSHNAGDSSFKYFDQKHWGTANYKANHDLYYLGARRASFSSISIECMYRLSVASFRSR